MFAILILILALLSLVHFIYDTILAPSLRWSARMDLLLAVRDLPKGKKLPRGHNDLRAASLIREGVANSISCLAGFDLASAYFVRRHVRSRPRLLELVAHRRACIESAADENVVAVKKRTDLLFAKIFLINMFLSVIIFAPFIIVLVLVDTARKWFTTGLARFTSLVRALLVLPSRVTYQVVGGFDS